MLRFSSLMICATFAQACSDSAEPELEIADAPLSGKINGADWALVSGYTIPSLSDQSEFFATMYPAATDPCGDGVASANRLDIDLPTQPGEFRLSDGGLRATFRLIDNAQLAHLAKTGVVLIDEISQQEITGGMHILFDENNELNGRFTIAMCVTE